MTRQANQKMMDQIEATVEAMMVTINRVMLEARLARECEANITPDPLTLMHDLAFVDSDVKP